MLLLSVLYTYAFLQMYVMLGHKGCGKLMLKYHIFLSCLKNVLFPFFIVSKLKDINTILYWLCLHNQMRITILYLKIYVFSQVSLIDLLTTQITQQYISLRYDL